MYKTSLGQVNRTNASLCPEGKKMYIKLIAIKKKKALNLNGRKLADHM